MTRRILLLFAALVLGVMAIGCAREQPYDARAIDSSEVDTPSQQERNQPASGGGKALSDRQW